MMQISYRAYMGTAISIMVAMSGVGVMIAARMAIATMA